VFGGDPFPSYCFGGHDQYIFGEGVLGIQKYCDWICGLGAIGIGYRKPAEVLCPTLSLPTREEEYTARQIIEDVAPWGEQVRFVKTGSEATAAAMMIARRATGRKKIVSIGYHGWHETHLPSENLVDVPWGQAAESMYEIDCRTAAVLLEPYRDEEPPSDYFHRIHSTCSQTGALLIMDEMVTGFRWALGGACEREGIVPDLACYGKAMGNGVPIACVVGSAKLMQHSHGVSSTFGGSLDGLRAAEETIEYYKANEVCNRIWYLGRHLIEKTDGRLIGFPVHPVPNVSDPVALTQHLAIKGHLIHPAGFNIMYDHTEENVDSLAKAIRSYDERV